MNYHQTYSSQKTIGDCMLDCTLKESKCEYIVYNDNPFLNYKGCYFMKLLSGKMEPDLRYENKGYSYYEKGPCIDNLA